MRVNLQFFVLNGQGCLVLFVSSSTNRETCINRTDFLFARQGRVMMQSPFHATPCNLAIHSEYHMPVYSVLIGGARIFIVLEDAWYFSSQRHVCQNGPVLSTSPLLDSTRSIRKRAKSDMPFSAMAKRDRRPDFDHVEGNLA